jgi:CrcB protein
VTALLVAVAGAAGALSRYGIASAVGARWFPWATLSINVTGSFLLGALVRAAAARGWPDTTTVPIAVGFIGAFTTFSTFSVETHTLLRDGRAVAALAYVATSVLAGLGAAALGYALASS